MRNGMILPVVLVLFVFVFSAVGFAVDIGDNCSSEGSSTCADDGDTQLYCNPDTLLWQHSQYCSTTDRQCSGGSCIAICGDGICGTYETIANCPGYTDCGGTACGSATCAEGDWCANVSMSWCCGSSYAYICDDGVCTNDLSTCTSSSTTTTCAAEGGVCCANSETCSGTWSGTTSDCGNYCCVGTCASNVTAVCDSSNRNYCYTESECTNVGGYWCDGSCWNSECTTTDTCTSAEPWKCYTETDCSGVAGTWCSDNYGNVWCQTGTCTDYSCNSNNAWNCKAETECTDVGGNWCTGIGYGWCQNYDCPSCSSSQVWNCYDEVSCMDAGGNWCGTWCTTSDCPTCDSSNTWNCYSETSCVVAGGDWCTSVCSSCTPYCTNYGCSECDSSNIWSCYTETECTGAGGEWCSDQLGYGWCTNVGSCPIYSESDCTAAGKNWCRPERGGTGWCSDWDCPTYTCDSAEPWNCKTETECTGAGANWCGSWCQEWDCPTCSSGQEWNCANENDCLNVGGNWCTDNYGYTFCQSGTCPQYQCSEKEKWNCNSAETCKGAGGNWCDDPWTTSGGYCYDESYSCPDYTCSVDNPWNCYSETDCSGIGAYWCTSGGTYSAGWCQNYECPVCDSDNIWSCYTESDCTGAGGSWCGNWCQNYDCPECSSSQPWNCYSKTECENTGKGNWCGSSEMGWCDSWTCPTCTSNQPWNCYTEDECMNAGGNWCDSWCQESYWECPSGSGGGGGNVEEIPEGCWEEIDPSGIVKIVCEEEIFTCPDVDFVWEEKCIEYGGEPEYMLDYQGCMYLDCKMMTKEEKNPWEVHGECPSDSERENAAGECKEFGGDALYIWEGGCEFVVCEHKEKEKCMDTDDMNPKIVKDIKAKCREQGLEVVEDYGPHGCPILTCGSADKYCKNVPAEAYNQCNGELIVDKNEEGCVVFSECIEPGEETVGLAPHEKLKDVPDADVLLDIAFSLEDLKIKFIELGEKTGFIAEFYEARDDLEAERFKRVSTMLYDAADKVDEIRSDLRDKLNDLTVEDLEQIKLAIRKLRKGVLKDVLYIMLSSDEDIVELTDETIKNCGSDEECFNRAFEICKPVLFTPGDGIEAEIIGIEGDLCVMKVEQEGLGMTCKVPDYSEGLYDPEEQLLPNCEGPLLDTIMEEV